MKQCQQKIKTWTYENIKFYIIYEDYIEQEQKQNKNQQLSDQDDTFYTLKTRNRYSFQHQLASKFGKKDVQPSVTNLFFYAMVRKIAHAMEMHTDSDDHYNGVLV